MKSEVEVRDMRRASFMWQSRNLVDYLKVLNPTAGVLYVVLTSYANQDQQCWPSQSMLAEILNVDVRTVQRAINELERHGLVRSELEGLGRYARKIYTLLQIEPWQTNPGMDVGIKPPESRSECRPIPAQMSCESRSQCRKNNNKRTRTKERLSEQKSQSDFLPLEGMTESPTTDDDNVKNAERNAQPLWSLPTSGPFTYPIFTEYLTKLKCVYPALNIESEIAQMQLWLEANPKRRKTRQGTRTFVDAWLRRSNRENENRQSKPGTGMRNVDDILRELDAANGIH